MAHLAALSAKDMVRVRAFAARWRAAGKRKPLLLTGRSAKAAAEVLANELRDVFRVDLSAVATKFIGETEKNLARAFDAAQGSPALIFDEADALFGKRSKVRDAHDHFAS